MEGTPMRHCSDPKNYRQTPTGVGVWQTPRGAPRPRRGSGPTYSAGLASTAGVAGGWAAASTWRRKDSSRGLATNTEE
jgi:hypothetical protein